MKIVHKAKLVSNNGDVSPLCANRPRKINLTKESWILRNSAVTCPKCLKELTAGSCKAEAGVQGSKWTRPCPDPALPGEDYCPLHLVLVKRLEERFQKRRIMCEGGCNARQNQNR